MAPFSQKSCLTQEQMNDYIEDRITDKERFLIEKHLIDCDLCSEAIEGLRQLSGMAETEACMEILGDRIHTQLSGLKKSKPTNKPTWQITYAIAAILILGLASVLTLFNEKSLEQTLFAEYFKPYPNTIRVLRGTETGHLLGKAMYEYEKADYKKAIWSLEKVLESEPGHIPATFYAGICFLTLNQPEMSIDYFQTVINDKENKFLQHALWYQGLAMLKANDPENGKRIFKEIASGTNPYSEQSEEILEKLNHGQK